MVDARQKLLVVNEAARLHGLAPGMLLGTATAILPSLHSLTRQDTREGAALASLADWALQFSSWVCPSPPQDLLLEIGGSLRLFKGLLALRDSIERGIAALGYQAQAGIAPTPRGAEVLARHGGGTAITLAAMRQQVARLPLETLGWEARSLKRLHAVGVRHIAACCALPRDGFIRRHGADKRRDLDRLLGLAADPRPPHRPAPVFQRQLELFAETTDTALLRPGFEHMFDELHAALIGRDCGVTRIHIELTHGRRPASGLSLGLLSPSRDVAQWLRLLDEHLQGLALPAPVRAIGIRADEFGEPGRRQNEFWPQADQGQRQALLERLAARLGPSALQGLGLEESHCPERAWRRIEPGAGRRPDKAKVVTSHDRPLWLLDTPRAIDLSGAQWLAGPERIETGWWEDDCRRDYYRVRLADGRRLWVFRAHDQPGQWLTHGLFA